MLCHNMTYQTPGQETSRYAHALALGDHTILTLHQHNTTHAFNLAQPIAIPGVFIPDYSCSSLALRVESSSNMRVHDESQTTNHQFCPDKRYMHTLLIPEAALPSMHTELQPDSCRRVYTCVLTRRSSLCSLCHSYIQSLVLIAQAKPQLRWKAVSADDKA